MKKIGVITTSRADYGLLRKIIRITSEDPKLKLQLFVTGSHLVHEYGYTVNQIVEDGFDITEKIDIILNSDSELAISKSIGLASISFSDALFRHKPDIIIVLGDRYELLPICSVANNLHIPIAHISGGEVTEGAIDDVIRHSVTKMSYLHFPANEVYRKRIIQLGESPNRVFNFGDVGVEAIKDSKIINLKYLEKMFKIKIEDNLACVIFHPTTIEVNSAEEQINNILSAIREFPFIYFLIIKSNADANNNIINKRLTDFCNTEENALLVTSLAPVIYLSYLSHSKFILGNSSSGIVEAPVFNVPTINIGDRQKGRLLAKSVINCRPIKNDIVNAINNVMSNDFISSLEDMDIKYDSNNTSYRIMDTIKDYILEDKINLKKSFYDIRFEV